MTKVTKADVANAILLASVLESNATDDNDLYCRGRCHHMYAENCAEAALGIDTEVPGVLLCFTIFALENLVAADAATPLVAVVGLHDQIWGIGPTEAAARADADARAHFPRDPTFRWDEDGYAAYAINPAQADRFLHERAETDDTIRVIRDKNYQITGVKVTPLRLFWRRGAARTALEENLEAAQLLAEGWLPPDFELVAAALGRTQSSRRR